MVDASALAIGSPRTWRIVDRGEEEAWFGVQVVGNDPGRIARAAERLSTLRPTVMDLNLGCPAPKVRRKGQGCSLVEHPDLVASCVRAMAGASSAPVTVKMRLTPEATAAPVIEAIRSAADAGAVAATVHGRTPRQHYGGPVHLDVLAEIVRASPVPVIANGGIHSRWHLERMVREVRPHAVMLASGVIGNPWLFGALEGPPPWGDGPLPADPWPDPTPSPGELAEVLVEHVEATVDHHGRSLGYARSRKLVLRYLKGRGLPASLRTMASRLSSRQDLDGIARAILGCASLRPRAAPVA